MKIAPLPENEASRLAALQCYQVLDTGPEDSFDDLTALAAQICDAPIALVSLIDTNRQWFKSKVGVEAAETSRDIAFCAHAILQSDIFIVPDAARDDRFADNPLVTSAPHIRFYAGMPLLTSKGEALGTLCVIDRVPRQLTPAQQDTLRRLGRQTVKLLEYRLSNREYREAESALRASESRLQDFLMSASDLIQSATLDGRLLFVNHAWLETLGYSEEDLPHLHLMDVIHPDCRAHCEQILQQLGAGPSALALETTFLSKSGRPIHVEGNVNCLTEEGRPVATRAIFRDITARKAAEERVRQSEAFLEAIIEHLPNLVFVKEAGELRHIRFNAACELLLGVSRQDVLGKNNYEIFPKEQADLYTAKDRAALASGTVVDIPEEPIQTKNKGIRFLHTKKVSIRDADGMPRYLLGISEDITERKQAERERQKHEAALARFKYTLDQTLDCVFMFSHDTLEFTYCNQGACEQVGYSHAELFTMTPVDIKPEFTRERFRTTVQPLLDGTQPSLTLETIHRHKDGHDIPVEISLQLVRQEGEAPRFVAIVRDITARKQTEAALRDSEARFRQVVESAPNGILMVRADGTITLVNAQIERLFGYSREELVGQAIDLLLPPGMRGSHAQNVARFFAAPSTRAMGANRDLFGLHKDGREVPIEIGLTPLETPDGPHVLASIIDITERKQAEAALHARQTLLDAANKELEAFAYSVSHDLRTPLRSIDGFSQALLEDYASLLDEQGRDYLQRVRSASQRMGQLIDDLLDLSRTARREFRRGPVDLSTLAHLTCEGLRRSDPDRQVEFVVAPGLVASGDIGLLRIVLDNLLGNAWKFTAKRPQARIEFGTTVASGVTTYFVRDNGAGFDMAYADKLFTPFQRLHGMTEFPGTGIGLATVSRIVHRHGGRIWAEGAVDQGVTVYFIL